jgi:hypothetical protein
MNVRRAAHEACINNIKDHCILRCDAMDGTGSSATVDEILVSLTSSSKFKVHTVTPQKDCEIWH